MVSSRATMLNTSLILGKDQSMEGHHHGRVPLKAAKNFLTENVAGGEELAEQSHRVS